MKKKIVLSLLIVLSLVMITGCNKDKKSTTKKKVSTDKEIVLKDEGFGTTTMTYSNDKDYVIKEEHSGKYTELTITSEKENFKMQLYHFDISSASFGIGKANRSGSEEFMEYTWNNYKGYTYNGDKNSISFNILLKDDSTSSKALFGSMEYVDVNTANVTETFRDENIQKLLNSITFEEK